MDSSLRFNAGGDYGLRVLGKDGERVLCRGWRIRADSSRKGILAVLPASENPTPLSLLAEEGLLAFDPVARAWSWNTDRVRARGGTDNVVDLIAEKLERLPAITRESLKQLACLGNGAEIGILNIVDGNTEDAMHASLWEAVRAGLVIRQGSAYNFVHDRVQQAAYALIPKESRAEAHLRIGRVLLAAMKADGFEEPIFDIANQFNRGTALLVDTDEKLK